MIATETRPLFAVFEPMPVIERIWQAAGLPVDRLPELSLTGSPGPELRSSFMISEAAQVTTALSALAASYLNELRTGEKRAVAVDKRAASLEFNVDRWTWLNDEKPGDVWDEYAGIYPAADGYLWIHTNYDHHRQRFFDSLGLKGRPSLQEVRKVVSKVRATEFETLATERGCVCSAVRSFQEWDESPQGIACRENYDRDGPVKVVRDGPGGSRATWARRPGHVAEGIKVVDMTRVVAGPVGGRIMALRGAEVLNLRSPNLPGNHAHDVESTRGKITAHLDLDNKPQRETFVQEILPSTDVFLQSYRDGSLAGRYPDIFTLDALRTSSPNLIVASLSAYGPLESGPWGGKRGYDSLVQAATGFNMAEGEAWAELNGLNNVQPRKLPVSVLDYAAGQLLAFGMLAALCRQYMDGGSYSVQVSLVSVAYLVRSLGRYPPDIGFSKEITVPHTFLPPDSEIVSHLVTYPEVGTGNPSRKVTSLRHAGVIRGIEERNRFAPIELDKFPLAWGALSSTLPK